MILKDVIQHGAVVPNNIDIHYPICNFRATQFIWFCHIIVMQPELVAIPPPPPSVIFQLHG